MLSHGRSTSKSNEWIVKNSLFEQLVNGLSVRQKFSLFKKNKMYCGITPEFLNMISNDHPLFDNQMIYLLSKHV